MEEAREEDTFGVSTSLPGNIRAWSIRACFLCFPSVISDQLLPKKEEILLSLCGHVLGPFLLLAPVSFRLHFVLGNVCLCISSLVSFSRLLRAFFIGVVASQLRMSSRLFTNSLCGQQRRQRVYAISCTLDAWMCFCVFFAAHFFPAFAKTVSSSGMILVLGAITAAAASKCVVETPEEVLSRYQKEGRASASDQYEALYQALSRVYGKASRETEEFDREYKALLDQKLGPATSQTGKERLKSAASLGNIAFMYIAAQRSMGVENSRSFYRMFLGLMQLCTSMLACSSTTLFQGASLYPVVYFYLMCVSTGSYEDIALVLLMLLGVGFFPTAPSAYAVTPTDLIVAASVQYALAALLFLLVSSTLLN